MASSEYSKKWRREHPTYASNYGKKYYQEHAIDMNKQNKTYRQNNPDLIKTISKRCYDKSSKEPHIKKRLKRLYGITPKQKQELFESQGSVCGACGASDPGPKGWSWDHDHTTGVARGVLCHSCNIALGLLKDSVERCQQLIAYLNFKPNYSFEVI